MECILSSIPESSQLYVAVYVVPAHTCMRVKDTCRTLFDSYKTGCMSGMLRAATNTAAHTNYVRTTMSINED